MKKKDSNRGFGILFFVVFLIISLWPIINDGNLRLWSMVVALIFLILGILNSRILNPFRKIWVKFGELLGKIISPIVLFIIFFLLVTPIGLLMKILGKDLLSIKYSKNKTYWINRLKDLGSMNNQF